MFSTRCLSVKYVMFILFCLTILLASAVIGKFGDFYFMFIKPSGAQTREREEDRKGREVI